MEHIDEEELNEEASSSLECGRNWREELEEQKKYWKSQDAWTLKEAALLICGSLPNWRDSYIHTADNFSSAIQFLRRAVEVGELNATGKEIYYGSYQDYPAYFDWLLKSQEVIKWASAKKDIFWGFLETFNCFAEDEATKEEKSLGTRERDTLLKIIGGLAMCAYRVDIHAKSMSNLKEIVDDLNGVGVTVSEQTLRNKLREAAGLIEKKQ